MKVLHARSVKASIARINKALAKIEAKQHTLNAQWDELAELRQVLTRQLPGVRDVPDLRSHAYDHLHMTDLDGTMSRWKKLPDLAMPPQATDTEQASGRWRGEPSATPVIRHIEASIDGRPWVPLNAEEAAGKAERPAAYIRGAPAFASPNLQPDHHEEIYAPLVGERPTYDPSRLTGDDPKAPQATNAEEAAGIPRSAKVGWPKGLSRKLTPCPHSALPHRHRVDDQSKPTELTCVDIQYPEEATAL